jgi:hypothetical protein
MRQAHLGEPAWDQARHLLRRHPEALPRRVGDEQEAAERYGGEIRGRV